jgi:hypothetical protein
MLIIHARFINILYSLLTRSSFNKIAALLISYFSFEIRKKHNDLTMLYYNII